VSLFIDHPVLGRLEWQEHAPRVLAGGFALTPKHRVNVFIDVPRRTSEARLSELLDQVGQLMGLVRKTARTRPTATATRSPGYSC
jgi:hypothetical protein